MVSRAVDDRLQKFGHKVQTIVNRCRPQVDDDVEAEIHQFVQWE